MNLENNLFKTFYNGIEECKSFNHHTIQGKVNHKRTVDGNAQNEEEKPHSIFQTHTVVHERAVVIEEINASGVGKIEIN